MLRIRAGLKNRQLIVLSSRTTLLITTPPLRPCQVWTPISSLRVFRSQGSNPGSPTALPMTCVAECSILPRGKVSEGRVLAHAPSVRIVLLTSFLFEEVNSNKSILAIDCWVCCACARHQSPSRMIPATAFSSVSRPFSAMSTPQVCRHPITSPSDSFTLSLAHCKCRITLVITTLLE